MSIISDKSVNEWTPEDVSLWLRKNGFEQYVDKFRDEHKMDGKCLLTLSEDDLRGPPLSIRVLGDIKRLSMALRVLQEANAELVFNLMRRPLIVGSFDSHRSLYQTITNDKYLSRLNHNSSPNLSYLLNDDSNSDDLSPDRRSHSTHEIKPEAWKALVAMLYFFAATWITAIVMVIVHDRVPDMQTYPPLPDLILDNVPLIPWAFSMCEVCGLVLFIIWSVILTFHKHRYSLTDANQLTESFASIDRFILLRRMFSLFGSVFFLRCVTMLITSLSVPGRHLQCKARVSNRLAVRAICSTNPCSA